MPEVTCVGVVVADVIVRPVDAWPQPGRLSLVEHIELHGGGLAYTTAVTLAKLGVSSAVVGRVGGDPLGTYLADGLRADGVEVHLRQDAESSTAATVVTVTSGGERSFLHLRGANGRLVAQDVPDELLARSRVLHLGGFFILPALDGPPVAELFRRAKAAGCRTSLDTAWDPQGRWMSALAPCLPYVNLLFGNREELASVAGGRDTGPGGIWRHPPGSPMLWGGSASPLWAGRRGCARGMRPSASWRPRPCGVRRPTTGEDDMIGQMGTGTVGSGPGQIPHIGVGLLGYAFMGKAHSHAFKTMAYMMSPPPAIPRLVAICGRDEAAVRDAAARYGYETYYTDWRALVADDRVQLFDNGGPNHLHAEPCIAAAAAGKHVLCEKPLARTAAEAQRMLDAVTRAGVKHMVAFNYRFVPAIRQARDLIAAG